jgi:pimeloyl-ACP methyl ester carboxylesterase
MCCIDVLEALRGRCRVILPDVRGFARSHCRMGDRLDVAGSVARFLNDMSERSGR